MKREDVLGTDARHAYRAFSLIELVIPIVIISVVTGARSAPIAARADFSEMNIALEHHTKKTPQQVQTISS
ncbi:MAG: hypothetical protein CMJ18_17210 [Phycisphaeraceae bacterium]|nr:hypothetical protein [Phycisphaeraceae bacterium]